MDKMRKALTLILALGWAACFLVQAIAIPDHPTLGFAGAGLFAAAVAAFLHILVAGLFLWLVVCTVSERSADLLMPFSDWLRMTFASAAAVVLLVVLAALPAGNANLLAIAFFQLTALLASFLVSDREGRVRHSPKADNDNVPLGMRLVAWNAARAALVGRQPSMAFGRRREGR
jgi:hypothetical protein